MLFIAICLKNLLNQANRKNKMKHNTYKSGISLLLSATLVLLFTGFGGCKNPIDIPIEPIDTIDTIKPFVRLLENETVQSKKLNASIKYAVLLPANYNTSTDCYPVVYLLHGYGDDQNAWYEYGLIKYYSDLDSAVNGPMIFVMPQGFNSYYVNRFNGSMDYMDFFTSELVPAIDAKYRTKKDKTQRAVMGFSMGGYGALILPAMNPDLFSISVPLSMSFRTDAQYLAETQSVFDYQWGPIFGGTGTSGNARLTNYFKEHSPFHFFDNDDLLKFSGLRIFLDCGDDEESLSVTNGALHNLMRVREISHEYRVKNGGHSWDYWHKSIHEALNFISIGFKGSNYPENPDPVSIGTPVPSEKYTLENVNGGELQIGVFKPTTYDSDANLYPVIFFIHDYQGSARSENALKIISLLNNNMTAGKIPNSIIVEIPEESNDITSSVLTSIIDQININYRIVADKNGRVLMGNGIGGTDVCYLIQDFQGTFNGCFLFDAKLDTDVQAVSDVYYYVDHTDKSDNYAGNYNLYLDLREKDNDHEYRIRQGTSSPESTLNGLSESMTYLSKKLRNQ
jgi:S-formylglutathione hydrolase FrmB